MHNDLYLLLEETLKGKLHAHIPIDRIVAITGPNWQAPANDMALRLNARVVLDERDGTLAIITRE